MLSIAAKRALGNVILGAVGGLAVAGVSASGCPRMSSLLSFGSGEAVPFSSVASSQRFADVVSAVACVSDVLSVPLALAPVQLSEDGEIEVLPILTLL